MTQANVLINALQDLQNCEKILKDNSLSPAIQMASELNIQIATLRDALQDAEYQLAIYADQDAGNTEAHNAHAKVQAALALCAASPQCR